MKLTAMTHLRSGNKTRASLFFLLTLGAPFWASAEGVPPEQGGPGTVDPNTVGVSEIVRFSLAGPTDEQHQVRKVATDPAGNHCVGSLLQRPTTNVFGQPQFAPPNAVLSQFDRANNLLWRRERKATSKITGQTTTYYEQYSDAQSPVVIPAIESDYYVQLAALTCDAQGNFIAGFNMFSGLNGRVAATNRILLVKFDNNGQFLWRRSTPEGEAYQPEFGDAATLISLTTGADGTVHALVDSIVTSSSDRPHESIVIKLASDGSRVTTNRYGVTNNGTPEFRSGPISLVHDDAGNLLLVTTEGPIGAGQSFNVIRKLDPAGVQLARTDIPLSRREGNNTSDTFESWALARCDGAGDLYVAGTHSRNRPSFNGPDQGEANQLLLRFNPNLTLAWRALGPQPKRSFSDQPSVSVMDLAISTSGITVGAFTSSNGTLASEKDTRWEVCRYAAENGAVLWHRLYQAPAANANQGFSDSLAKIAVDAAGNVYATGGVSQPAGGLRLALIKYASNGDLQFVKVMPDEYFAFEAASLTLPSATERPTMFGRYKTGAADWGVIELDNPAVVLGPPDVFGNIATRARVGTGDNVLIGGFIVTGPAGSTKKVMFRAIGPSLAQAGVSGVLADTTLTLTDGSGHTTNNDEWKKSQDPNVTDAQQQAAVIATTIPPSNDHESALVATLVPGNYTVIVGGKGGSGVALVEVYDLDVKSSAQLANIATRGKIETGENVLIGGVIVLGNDPSHTIVRAIGPSLTAAGVQNALQDTVLTVVDGNGVTVGANDNWRIVDGTSPAQSQEAEIVATTVPPSDDRESAVVLSLNPGNYTVIVRGKNGATGVGLVEAYKLP